MLFRGIRHNHIKNSKSVRPILSTCCSILPSSKNEVWPWTRLVHLKYICRKLDEITPSIVWTTEATRQSQLGRIKENYSNVILTGNIRGSTSSQKKGLRSMDGYKEDATRHWWLCYVNIRVQNIWLVLIWWRPCIWLNQAVCEYKNKN